MPITLAQTATLKTAITGDTALTAFVTGRDCQAIAAYYAEVTATLIQHQSLPRAEFLMGIMQGVIASNAGTAAMKEKWDRFLRTISQLDYVRLSQAPIPSLLTLMVTDSLMTQAQVDAFSKRAATRGENLLGAGVVISIQDVAGAMFNPDGSLKA